MDIGNPDKEYTVVPTEIPAPDKQPAKAPDKEPEPVEE